MTNARTLECALYYISRGWLVIPCYTIIDGKCQCGSPECGSPGKHPHSTLVPRGSKQASKDEKKVRQWFSSELLLNIAVVAGPRSGLVLLDVDPRHGGDESLAKYKVPRTLEVITGSGGRHYYFKHPGTNIHNSAGKLGPGVDVRGHNGYVVAPPSLHISGAEYRWAQDPRAVEIAICPKWIKPKDESAAPPAGNAAMASGSAAGFGGEIEQGQRDNTLISIAGSFRNDGLAEQEIYVALAAVNQARCNPPLPDADIKRIARSATQMEIHERSHHLTDVGNAERFTHEHKGKLIHDHNRGKWLNYDGRRWNAETGDVVVVQAATKTARSILAEAAEQKDEDVRKKIVKWAFQSENNGRIKAMVNLASYTKGMAKFSSLFDTDPWLFNCLNGTIDLRTGKLCPHNSASMITKLAPVIYDPKARNEVFEQVLLTALDDNKEIIDFLRRAMGYTLTGSVQEECLFLVHGEAATGKSTILQSIRATMGEYAKIADFETFCKKKGDSGPRNDLAALAGARYVQSIEIEEGKSLAEGIIKNITGKDTVTARFLYGELFEFTPQFKLWLACNEAPRVKNTDSGMWRRIHRIPFDHVIPPEKRDPTIKDTLMNSAIAGPAILAWMVRGCHEWLEGGLQVPLCIQGATAAYRESQDPLLEYAEERLEFSADAFCSVTEIRSDYDTWCKNQGIRYPLSPREFNKQFEQRGCKRQAKKYTKNDGEMTIGKCWIGVTLLQAAQYDDKAVLTDFTAGLDDDDEL